MLVERAEPTVASIDVAAAPTRTATEPGRRRWTWTERLAAPVVFAGAFVVLLVRPPGIPTWRVLYAEDGTRFVMGPIRHRSITELLDPYAGYYHLLPRALGWGAYVAPVEYVPTAMAAGAAAVAVVALFCLAAGLRRPLPSPWMRLFTVVSVVLAASMGQEVSANAADLHYFLLLGMAGLSLLRAGNLTELALTGPIAIAFALSEPVGLLLLPVAFGDAAIRARTERRSWTGSRLRHRLLVWGLPVSLLAGLLPQVPMLGDRPAPTRAPLTGSDIAIGYVGNVIGRGISPELTVGHGGGWLTVATAVVVVPLLVTVVVLGGRARRLNIAAAALLAAMSVVFFVLPVTLNNAIIDRYTVVPVGLLICALLVLAAGVPQLHHALFVVVVVALITAELISWNVPIHRGRGPSWTVSVQQARAECIASDLSPRTEVWLPIAPSPWKIPLSCDRLLGD